MQLELEYRSAAELRRKPGSRTLEGYAIRFDSPSLDFGGFREQIPSDCKISWDDPRAYWNHNTENLLARASSKTLRIGRDAFGIPVEIDLPNTSVGNDVLELVERGDCTGMSFGFSINQGGFRFEKTAEGLFRYLTDINVGEVSPVSEPAYPSTSIGRRSLELAREQAAQYLRSLEPADIQQPVETPAVDHGFLILPDMALALASAALRRRAKN